MKARMILCGLMGGAWNYGHLVMAIRIWTAHSSRMPGKRIRRYTTQSLQSIWVRFFVRYRDHFNHPTPHCGFVPPSCSPLYAQVFNIDNL
ncbi:hypothetical protein DL98DRAFT_147147 [Cadophora sp. DSE1049]|nr:hypothetical protein DL98DRAFT_147147 [Cadophora sp. DSE1049]